MVLAGRWYLPSDVLMSSVTQWGMDRQTIAVNLLKEVISLSNEELWHKSIANCFAKRAIEKSERHNLCRQLWKCLLRKVETMLKGVALKKKNNEEQHF